MNNNFNKNKINEIFAKAKRIRFKKGKDSRLDYNNWRIERSSFEKEGQSYSWTVKHINGNENDNSIDNLIPISHETLNCNMDDRIVDILNDHKQINDALPVVAVAFINVDDKIDDMFIQSNKKPKNAKNKKDRSKFHAEQLILDEMSREHNIDTTKYNLAINIPPCNFCFNKIKGKFKNVYYLMDKKAAKYIRRDIDFLRDKSYVKKYNPRTNDSKINSLDLELRLEVSNIRNSFKGKLENLRKDLNKNK